VKGIRVMVLAIASSLVSLACQGCASTGADAYAYAEPATAPSLGMTLAVPGAFGDGSLNTPTGRPLGDTPLPSTSPLAQRIQLSGPEARISVYAIAPPPSAFSLTGSGLHGVPQGETSFGWSASPLLASVAAQLSAARYGQPDPEYNDVSFGLAIAATGLQTGLGFDVGVAPRVGIRDGGILSGQRLGGELRFGQGLDLAGSAAPKGWYVFVGAEGEALVWDANMKRLGTTSFSDMQVTDQLTVGDLQAGVSIQRAGGELSLSYIRREIEFSDRNRSLSDSEDFAGITFTMRR
jgi:Uncharacterized protein conserved in bacteria (DUF2219)